MLFPHFFLMIYAYIGNGTAFTLTCCDVHSLCVRNESVALQMSLYYDRTLELVTKCLDIYILFVSGPSCLLSGFVVMKHC